MKKHVFDPFLTPFWSQNGPLSSYFGIFHGPKRITTGSKWAKTTCLSIPNGLGSPLEKCGFDPFLTRFWSQNGPFSRHFGIYHGPKRVTMGSKRPKTTWLSMPSGLETTLEKIIFFAPGTMVDPPLAPAMRWPGGPLAPPSDHWYGGLGGELGDSEEPQKVGGCGCTRCPRNSVLSHVAQDAARSWFWACLTQIVHIQAILSHFWAVSWTYRGVSGQQRALCHRAIKAHVKCLQPFPFVWPFGVGFGAVLGQKRMFWGTKCAGLGGDLPTWRPRPRAPPVSSWLKTWIWQGHHLGNRMARLGKDPRQRKGEKAKMEA